MWLFPTISARLLLPFSGWCFFTLYVFLPDGAFLPCDHGPDFSCDVEPPNITKKKATLLL